MLKKELIQEFQQFLTAKGYVPHSGTRSISFQMVKGTEILTFEKVKASYNPYDQDITGRGDSRRMIKEFIKLKTSSKEK